MDWFSIADLPAGQEREREVGLWKRSKAVICPHTFQPINYCSKLVFNCYWRLSVFLLFFAFMILPEHLVSAHITREISAYSDSDNIAYEVSDKVAAEWQFHLKFPFVRSVFENPPAMPIAEQDLSYLSRVLMMLQHFGEEVFIPVAGIK